MAERRCNSCLHDIISELTDLLRLRDGRIGDFVEIRLGGAFWGGWPVHLAILGPHLVPVPAPPVRPESPCAALGARSVTLMRETASVAVWGDVWPLAT